jgi:1-phosphofructokinase
MAHVDGPRCVVVGPVCYLTVMIEPADELQRVHVHPGGQGFWIARMVHTLGCDAVLVAPTGGEAGVALTHLAATWGVTMRGVAIARPSPTQVNDRSTGERVELVAAGEPVLDRHEADDLYGAVLEASLTADVVVLTAGTGRSFPIDSYRRLVGDLITRGVRIVGDLHGEALGAALDGVPEEGPGFDVLKVSSDDLVDDGWTIGDEVAAVAAAEQLRSRSRGAVVVSRAGDPAIAALDDGVVRITPPRMSVVDHRGAGDSMTGAVAAARVYGLDRLDAIRLGAAAGAGNVTRHGLGSGNAGLIGELLELVDVEEIARDAGTRAVPVPTALERTGGQARSEQHT